MSRIVRRLYILPVAFSLILTFSATLLAQTESNAEKQARAKAIYDEAIAMTEQTQQSYSAKLEKYRRANSLYEEINDQSEDRSNSLIGAGLTAYSLGKNSDALKYYNEALSFSRKNQFKSSEAQALSGIGLIYKLAGENQQALKFFDQALAIRRENGDKRSEAFLLAIIGDIYSGFGENQKAFDFYYQALPIHRQFGDRNGEASVLGKIALSYYVLDERQKALDFYEQKLSIEKQTGDKRGEAFTLNGIGQIHQKSDPPKALKFYENALSLYKQIEDRDGEGGVSNNLGFTYDLLGEKQKALEYYFHALEIFRKTARKSAEARVLLNIARAYSTSTEKQKAVEFYSQSLLLLKQVGDKIGEAKMLGDVMTFWQAQKNSKLAVLNGKQAVNLYQELRSNILGLNRETQKTYLESIEYVYRRLADILIAQGRIAEAEEVLAMLKEEEFFAYLRRDDKVAGELKAKISLSPEEKKAFEDYEKFASEITRMAEEYESLKKKIPFGETFASLPADEQAKYKDLENKYYAAVTVFNKYLDDLKIKFGGKDERIVKIESDTIGLLKSLAQPRTVIISTIVGEDRLNLIVTTSDIQKAHTVEIKAAELNKLVADFRDAIKNPNLDPRPSGKMLYDKLFPAALQKDLENIKADTIIWSLDGTLRYVPMSALWDGEKYLVERYNNAVITLASRDKLNSNADSDRTKWQAFGVGVSKKFESFSELPAVPKELCSVVKDEKKIDFCKTYGKDGVFHGLILPDEEFTFDIFQQNLGKTAIVHIASHFSLNAGNETDSYLLLGGGTNRRFSLDSLKKTRLDKIELLTLSACNTAMTSGANSSGVEIEGFGALAQNQGAKSVLATLWAVADDSTRDLMTGFYQILETNPNAGKAEALRQSQIALLQGKTSQMVKQFVRSDLAGTSEGKLSAPPFAYDAKKPFAHPYFWSPFVLIGNWR